MFYEKHNLTVRERYELARQTVSIAPTETGETASRPYSAGDYFFLDGIFCKARTAIAQGSRFTLNTNYEEKILAVELAALNK